MALWWQANMYLFKSNNINAGKRCETCSELTVKTPEWRHWGRFGVFIVKVSTFFYCFYCWLWVCICFLGMSRFLHRLLTRKFEDIYRFFIGKVNQADPGVLYKDFTLMPFCQLCTWFCLHGRWHGNELPTCSSFHGQVSSTRSFLVLPGNGLKNVHWIGNNLWRWKRVLPTSVMHKMRVKDRIFKKTKSYREELQQIVADTKWSIFVW